MRVTFLGHQGWQIENRGRSLLLDPILESVGNGAQRMPIWPQRRLDFTCLAPLDAVIISHEHADHFSLETLHALPRHCAILVSDLSSNAMTTAIAELGFKVERFSALRGFVINGITVTPLPGLYNLLEPDAYALLMQDEGNASFLTAIDTVAHPDVFGWLAQHCPVRTLDSFTNNFIEPRQSLLQDPQAYTQSRALVAANAMEFVRKFTPRRAVISGQGWSFQGAKAPLNHSCFSVDNTWLASAARELAPHVEWFDGEPGMRFTLQADQVTVDRSPAIPAGLRTSRTFRPEALPSEVFEPWSELHQLAGERLKAVRAFILERFGLVLGAHAPKLMEALYYLKSQDIGHVVPTLGLSLRNGESRCLYEFDYGHLVMREARSGRSKPPALGLELWASDFELLLGAQEEAFTIYESAVQRWNHVPGVIDDALLMETLLWFTPRFRPQEFLGFYRSQIAALAALSVRWESGDRSRETGVGSRE